MPRSRTCCRSPTCSPVRPTRWSRSRQAAKSFRSSHPSRDFREARRAVPSTQAHRQRGETAETRTATARWCTVQSIGREALEEALDRDTAFEPCQTHAGAHVNAGAEGEMPRRVSPHIEAIGIGEDVRIAIGGADTDGDERACWHRDAAERRFFGRDPVAELVRAFEAQRFFDRALHQLGLFDQAPSLLREANENLQRIADEVGRGLVARVEDEDAILRQFGLGELAAIVLAGDEARQQILFGITGLAAAIFRQTPETVSKLMPP